MDPTDILELDPIQLANCQPILPDLAATANHYRSLDGRVVIIHHDALPPGQHLRFRTPAYHAIYALHGCPQLEATIGLHAYSHDLALGAIEPPFSSLLPAGTLHEANWSQPLHVTCLFLHQDLVGALAQELGVGPDPGLIPEFIIPDPTLYHLVCDFKAELTQSALAQAGPMYQQSLTTALALLLIKNHSVCFSRPPATRDASLSCQINLVLEYVTTHLEAELSLDHLASLVGLSPVELLQTFEEAMGVTLQNHIQQQRIQRLDGLMQRLKTEALKPWEPAARPGLAAALKTANITRGIDRVIPWLNQLLLAQTGKPLNDTQTRIVLGVLQGERYGDIARRYNQSEGHLKGVASEFWKLLSEVCGEPIRKPNLWSYLRRQGLLQD
ncbi:MAG: AraC family transcriptional regulator [Cyanobacteria bacterium REEB459]|nr:AraC family transcriptional regulator [Cyanobacteria bacterium REEB459]